MSKENTVLIVEDSPAVAMLLKSYLGKLGYSEIHICETGAGAVTTFNDLVSQKKQPIVLLDYMLPDMAARSVLTQMLEKQPNVNPALLLALDSPARIRAGCFSVAPPRRYSYGVERWDWTHSKWPSGVYSNEPSSSWTSTSRCIQLYG